MLASRHFCLIFVLGALCLCSVAAEAVAQVSTPSASGDASTKTDTPPAIDPKLQTLLGSPRATIESFQQAVKEERWDDALLCLNQSAVDGLSTPEVRQQTVQNLWRIIDRMWQVDLSLMPDAADELEDPWNLAQVADLDDPLEVADAQQIEIKREPDQLYRFAKETVEAVDDLWQQWKPAESKSGEVAGPESFEVWLDRWVESNWPSWRETSLWLRDYMWLALLAVLFLGFLGDILVRVLLWWITSPWIKHFLRSDASDVRIRLWKPVGLLMQAVIWYHGTKALGLPVYMSGGLLWGLKLFAVVAAVWTAFLFINLLAAFLAKKAARTTTKFDDLLVPMLSRSLKVVAVCLGLISGAQIFELPLAAIVGGLGVGGLALGLAAQESIKNFLGSIMIFTDRPFELGDRIVVDGHDGPVESVGFRSTRIRTLEGHLVTIPNGELANRTILNIDRRPHIRRTLNITITYDTPRAKIERALEIVREILADHEGMDPEYPPRVYFNEMNADSLNIWAIYWYHPADYWAYSEFSERVNLAIFRRFEEEGIEFAFPTQTLFLAGDTKRPLPTASLHHQRNGETAAAGPR